LNGVILGERGGGKSQDKERRADKLFHQDAVPLRPARRR
jgi:hypothetical protein